MRRRAKAMKAAKFALAVVGLVCGSAAMAEERLTFTHLPEIGTSRTVGIGEEILRTQIGSEFDAIVLLEDARYSNGWLMGSTRVPRGTQVFLENSERGFVKACLREPYICFYDEDRDGIFDRVTGTTIAGSTIREPVPYGETTLTGAFDFERAITFSGADRDSLRFSYREFRNNMARDAFTEELVVPREEFPQTILLKGNVFRVEAVGGMGITYTLVSTAAEPPMNDPASSGSLKK